MSKKRFVPHNSQVLIKQFDPEDAMYGSLHIPDMGKDRPLQGEVIAVGPGSYQLGVFVPVESKVGQIVNFPPLGSWKIQLDTEEFIIAKDQDIYGHLEDEDNVADN